MCGFIVLIKKEKGISRKLIKSLEKKILHRGPDSGGYLSIENVTLIFRRLSIIDLSKFSNQPMRSTKENISLVFNGEIYNYVELRKKLIAKGYIFKSTGDAEVILNGYLEWGEKISEKLEGMFAFAILDLNKRSILISRDSMGIKPLYIMQNSEMIFVSSEIRPLKEITRLEFDKKSLNEIVLYRYASGKSTGYKNVYKVLAGHNYLIDIDKHKIKKKKYFNIFSTFQNKHDKNFYIQTKNLIFDSFVRHTQSDVGFAVQLSGGLDSSLVVAYLQKKYGEKLSTYSIRLDSNEFDEKKYIRYVNKKYPTNHQDVFFDSKIFADSFEKTIKSLEGPTTHFGCVVLYELCRNISLKNKVVLTGEGADEIFGGYSRYNEIDKIINLTRIANFLPKKIIEKIPRLKFLNNYKNKNPYLKLITFRAFDILKDIFNDIDFEDFYSEKIFNQTKYPYDKIAVYDQVVYLESLLIRQDKISMAHGLEARVPYVDKKLIKFVNSISYKQRYKSGATKNTLKQISRDYFSIDFIHRKKNGLNLPISSWLKNKDGFGRFIEYFEQPDCKLMSFCDKKKIKKLVQEFYFHEKNYLGKILAQLINIEVWLRSISVND